MQPTPTRWLPAILFLIAAALTLSTLTLGTLRAQQAPHPARDLQLESIEWMTDGSEFLDRKRFKTSMTKDERAFDRTKLIDDALARAKQVQKPVLVYVYKISEKSKSGRQMIRAPVLDVYMRQLIWSDPDIERMVTQSFVPVRTVFDDAMCERFSVRPLTFLEPAILFLTPAGELLHELRTIRTFDAPWIAQVLRDVLDKAHGPLVADDIDSAKDRGDWQRALALLEAQGSTSARGAYEQATMLRRLRRGKAALAALDTATDRLQAEATAAKKPAAEQPQRRRRRPRLPKALQQLDLEIAAERGSVLIKMARFDKAVTPLMKAADARPEAWGEGPSRRAEARYRLALLRLRGGDESGALRRFQRLAQDDPDDLYAHRAEVNMRVGIDDGLSLGAPMFGYQRLAWLPDGAFTKLAANTHWPAEPLTDVQIVDNCVRALLAQQRSHGGWTDSRYAYCPDARITPNVWVAITAICCQALHRHRDQFAEPELIDAALRRGEAYMLDPNQMNRGRNEDVYSDSYRLMYLSHRWTDARETAQRERLANAMKQIVAAARQRQKNGGFWAHEYSNAFCTAAMVQGLLAAKEVGIDIPADMLSQATTALASARSKDGAFSYGGAARGKTSATGLKNASTRMPMCEAALFTLGASNEERLQFAFDNFWQHYQTIEGVRHTDFHSDGQIAGFMFLHSLYHTSEAMRLLPEERANTERKKMRERLLQYPEIDGTFLDSEELGRSYGTAMALLILANTK
jgi:tetratricopeptide (TPR) repeat protein